MAYVSGGEGDDGNRKYALVRAYFCSLCVRTLYGNEITFLLFARAPERHQHNMTIYHTRHRIFIEKTIMMAKSQSTALKGDYT